MKLIDPVTGQAVWDSNDPNAGPVPPAPEGREWVRLDEPGDTMAPRRTAPGILDIGNGVIERLAFLNQTFNPVEGIGGAMRAGSRMMAPDQSYWDRIASLGEMASGVASIAAPIAAAKAIGVPAASAMMEGLLGASPTSQAATDMARGFVTDESGALRLYHGSPHDFDRFSMSKIGTGEGAQAYGPGLYFAENEAIARGYRDTLSARAAPNDARGNAFDLVQRMGGDEAATAEILRDAIASTPSPNTQQFLTDTLRHIEEKTYADFERPLGRMYEVEVNANPEDFLDWDKPLSEQPQVVQDFANARWQQIYGRAPDPAIEGEYIAKMASPQGGIDSPDWLLRGGPGDAQRERLREAGIPGIRYLDAGSRGAGTGTRNYVVFDENLINIVRKYGIAGAATMLGVSAFDVEQALAENMSPSQWDQLVVGPQ